MGGCAETYAVSHSPTSWRSEVSNVIDFLAYKEKKLEIQLEKEWELWDTVITNYSENFNKSFTLTIDDKTDNIIFSTTIDLNDKED